MAAIGTELLPRSVCVCRVFDMVQQPINCLIFKSHNDTTKVLWAMTVTRAATRIQFSMYWRSVHVTKCLVSMHSNRYVLLYIIEQSKRIANSSCLCDWVTVCNPQSSACSVYCPLRSLCFCTNTNIFLVISVWRTRSWAKKKLQHRLGRLVWANK